MIARDVSAAGTGEHDAGLRVLGPARPRRGIPGRLLRLASDERLVEQVRAGSEPAFEALFDRHHRGVLAFCRHMLGSAEEAEDAVQHTFLAAFRELVGTSKPVQLRPWLYTIARNRCLTLLRTRARQAVGELHEPPTEHLAAEVERRHELRNLLHDVAHLPEDQRSALVLSELGDMSHDEIADVLGCRREKVKALVFQARSSLIASRTARELPCDEIREQLANLRGGSLRRNELRRHLSECPGCREFRAQVRAQRRDLALVLPVAPTVGLKSAVIGAAVGGGSAAGASTVAGGALATKLLVVAAVAGGGTVAVESVSSRGGDTPPARQAAPAAVSSPQGTTVTRYRSTTPSVAAAKASPSLTAKADRRDAHATRKADHAAAKADRRAERAAVKADRRAEHAAVKADRRAEHAAAKADRRAEHAAAKPPKPAKAKPAKPAKPTKVKPAPHAKTKPAKPPKPLKAAKPAETPNAGDAATTTKPDKVAKPPKPAAPAGS